MIFVFIFFQWLKWLGNKTYIEFHVERCFFLQVIYDKVTGRSRGFGFVTMSTAEEVAAAAQQLNGYVSQFILISSYDYVIICASFCGVCFGLHVYQKKKKKKRN